mmetsp:Transcript_7100/g.27905  ORF Transcript_7100/g.27905 Transcript_7100/m.27905 type:complete len:619 (+) Transcript_7100:390-2246(+)
MEMCIARGGAGSLGERHLPHLGRRRRRRDRRGHIVRVIPHGVILRFHRGEQQHLLDVRGVGEHHRQAVDTDAPAPRRRQAVLQGLAEGLVHEHRLVVAGSLLLRLVREPLALHDGVVQLGVRVAHLALVHEELEPLRHVRQRSVVLGQRRHDLGVVADETRVEALGLEVISDEGVQKPRGGVRERALAAHPLHRRLEKRVALVALERHRDLYVERLLEVGDHAEALERRGKVDLDRGLVRPVGVVLNLVRSLELEHHAGDELLGHLHQILVIRVRHVKLAGCKLGVVGHVDALVAELTADLVHAVHAADDEFLEVELGCDAHVQGHVEVVMVRDEGLGGGAAGDHVHHRSLNLHEILVVQVLADASDDVGPGDENVANLGVHDEVEVPLAVPGLLILEAGETGEHVQARRQHLHVAREDGQLALLGFARVAADADDVSAAGRGVALLEVVLGGVLSVRHDLDLHAVAPEIVEEELRAGRSLGHQSARDGDDDIRLNLPIRDGGRELLDELGELRVDVELVRVRVLAPFLALQDLVDPVGGVLSGVELALLLLLGFLLGGLGCGLGSLGGLLLSLGLGVLRSLEALLVLALGELLAGELGILLELGSGGGLAHLGLLGF